MTKYRLPIIHIVVQAYRVFFDNLGVYLKLIWFPFGMSCVAMILETISKLSSSGNVDESIVASLVVSIIGLLALVMAIPAITAWHRLVILGPDDINSRIRYSFRHQEWRYLWKVFGLGMAIGLVAAVILFAYSQIVDPHFFEKITADDPSMIEPAVTIAGFIGIFAISGFLVLLPAAAVGIPMSIRSAIEFSKGNWWRISAIYLIALAPEIFFGHVITFARDVSPNFDFGGIINIFDLVSIIITFVFFMITVGALSLAYKALADTHHDESALAGSE